MTVAIQRFVKIRFDVFQETVELMNRLIFLLNELLPLSLLLLFFRSALQQLLVAVVPGFLPFYLLSQTLVPLPNHFEAAVELVDVFVNALILFFLVEENLRNFRQTTESALPVYLVKRLCYFLHRFLVVFDDLQSFPVLVDQVLQP